MFVRKVVVDLSLLVSDGTPVLHCHSVESGDGDVIQLGQHVLYSEVATTQEQILLFLSCLFFIISVINKQLKCCFSVNSQLFSGRSKNAGNN